MQKGCLGEWRVHGLFVCVVALAVMVGCAKEDAPAGQLGLTGNGPMAPTGPGAGIGGPDGPAVAPGPGPVASPVAPAGNGPGVAQPPGGPTETMGDGDGMGPGPTPVPGDDMTLADGGMDVPTDDAGMGDAAMPPAMHEDLGEGDGSDVITIGDSWMDYFASGGGIQTGLARKGKRYRNYALSGTQFLNGVIPRQYQTAKRANPDIKTVIMTGGGNDILLGGYSCDTKEQCQEYVEALVKGLNELWTEMSNDGVKDVLYINYSRDAGSSPAENRPTMTPVAPICVTGPIRCHSLQTTDIVNGQLLDGIHPTMAANDRIAAAVIDLMVQEGMRR